MNDAIFERLKSCIVPLLRDCDPDRIVPQAHLRDDLEVDSMFMVESAVAMEDEFGLNEIKDEDVAKFRTIGDMVTFIKDRLSSER